MVWRTAGSGVLSPRHLQLVRSDAELLDLHRSGLTHTGVAAAGGYATASGARKAVKRALDRCAHPDRAMLVHLEYHRLETLYAALWNDFDSDPTPARRNRLTTRILAVLDLQAKLTADFTVDLPPIKRPSPARPVGVWSTTLQQRLDGATLDQLATAYGVGDRSAARKKLARELDDYAAGSASAYRDEHAARLDEAQLAHWDQATADRPDLGAVDIVVKIITRRIRVLGLAPTDPAKPKGRRGRRPPPAPGPLSTIHTYWDDVDPRTGLAGTIDAPIIDPPMTTP